jgi:hypothetical protein
LVFFVDQLVPVVSVVLLQVKQVGELLKELEVRAPVFQLLDVSAKRKPANNTSGVREYLSQRQVQVLTAAEFNHINHKSMLVRGQLQNRTSFSLFLVLVHHRAAPLTVSADDWLANQHFEFRNVIGL